MVHIARQNLVREVALIALLRTKHGLQCITCQLLQHKNLSLDPCIQLYISSLFISCFNCSNLKVKVRSNDDMYLVQLRRYVRRSSKSTNDSEHFTLFIHHYLQVMPLATSIYPAASCQLGKPMQLGLCLVPTKFPNFPSHLHHIETLNIANDPYMEY